MSDREAEDGQNTRLPRALIWVGVGLAPVAALVVLLGGGEGPMRFGVLLIAVCVVLLGASLLIRNDPVLLRMDVEDRVAAEVAALRSELRSEFATAASRAAAAPAPIARVAASPAAARAVPAPPGQGVVRPGNAQVRAATGPVRAAAAVRPEPGHTTGGRAVVPQPEPTHQPDSDYAYGSDVGYGSDAGYGSDVAYGSDADYEFGPDHGADLGNRPDLDYVAGYPPEFDYEPEPGRATQRGYPPEPGRRVASAPGWPESRPTPSGRASASVGAATVSRGPVGGHPVPGQRGRGAASVPPPMAPVFRPPAPQPPRTPSAGGPRRVDDQGGRRRADVTAVDLGYTGRRSRSSHSVDDLDRRSEADVYDGGDPHAEQYDWRSRENTGGW